MIKLGQAGSHLAAARSGSSHNDQRTAGFDIIIFSIALVADDQRDIAGIALDAVMAVYLDSHMLQLGLKDICARLALIQVDHNASHIKAFILKLLNQAQYIHIIGDPQILAYLIFLYIRGADHNDDLSLVGQLKEHPKLAVRCEAGKNPGGVVVIKQLSSKFQIKLITKLADPFSDVFRLHGKVLIIVKSDLHVFRSPNILFFIIRSRQRINCFLV